MPAYVTEHADFRARKRLGLPRKAVQRLADRALEEGATPEQFSGAFRQYLMCVFREKEKADTLRVYRGSLFLFCAESFITCWRLPKEYQQVKPAFVPELTVEWIL